MVIATRTVTTAETCVAETRTEGADGTATKATSIPPSEANMGAPIAAARAIEIEAAAATELTGRDGERASEKVERRDKKNKRQNSTTTTTAKREVFL